MSPADCPPVKAATPVAADSTEKSTASTPVPADAVTAHASSPGAEPAILNGNPKSPEDNNNLHVSPNNNTSSSNITTTTPTHIHNNNNNGAMTPLNAAAMLSVNFLRGDDLKSPYRFDDHRSPFRFADELGMPGAMVGRLGESLIPKGDPMEARLQEMLRYNMDKYATQNLDTLHIARRVRELLSIHNIGQRLFAKYILGLSQGTVSELLSKPKPWDKLTEKGRDSYRKMHAWACDENAVMLLKSLIPKKGKVSHITNTFILISFTTNKQTHTDCILFRIRSQDGSQEPYKVSANLIIEMIKIKLTGMQSVSQRFDRNLFDNETLEYWQ